MCNYVDGKTAGEQRQYYKNGQLHIICNCVNDKIEGEFKEYHKNGELYKIYNFVAGKEENLCQSIFRITWNFIRCAVTKLMFHMKTQ